MGTLKNLKAGDTAYVITLNDYSEKPATYNARKVYKVGARKVYKVGRLYIYCGGVYGEKFDIKTRRCVDSYSGSLIIYATEQEAIDEIERMKLSQKLAYASGLEFQAATLEQLRQINDILRGAKQ